MALTQETSTVNGLISCKTDTIGSDIPKKAVICTTHGLPYLPFPKWCGHRQILVPCQQLYLSWFLSPRHKPLQMDACLHKKHDHKTDAENSVIIHQTFTFTHQRYVSATYRQEICGQCNCRHPLHNSGKRQPADPVSNPRKQPRHKIKRTAKPSGT